MIVASVSCNLRCVKTMETVSVFNDFSNGDLGQVLRAKRELSNININSYYKFFMGAKGGDAWK